MAVVALGCATAFRLTLAIAGQYMSTLVTRPRSGRFGIAALTLVLGGLVGSQASAQSRAFQKVFTGNLPGQLVVMGNSIVTCDRTVNSAADCNAVETGAGPPTLNNDQITTAFIDIDGDAATFNSSAATLAVNGQIEWAGLYWWGSTDAEKATRVIDIAGRGSVLLKAPGGAYASVASSWLVPGDPYLAYADVTALVKAGGAGAYHVANVVTFGGSDDHLGGWSLVVVNRDDALPFRHISVYDGYQTYGGGTPVSVQFQDFLTPLIGPLNAQATFVALDGDASRVDAVTFNNAALVGPLNPLGDFGNSTITSGGVGTARNPAFSNTLGTDIDTFDVSSLVTNGASSATATFSGESGETNFAALMGFQTTLYSPDIKADKSFVDVNGGETRPGDALEYTVLVRNEATAQDGAVQVVLTDLIPTNSSFVPGSLKVTATTADAAPVGPLTDAAGDDAGEYDAAAKQVTVRLGALATTLLGGTLSPSAAMTISFQVTVAPDLIRDTILSNLAKVTFKGLTLSQTAGSAVITVTSNSPVTGGPTTTPIKPTDTDNDGLSDRLEMNIATDPNDADTDDDGLIDGQEPSFDVDSDMDGKINALDPDSDDDGIFDGTEAGKDCSNAATNKSKNVCVPDADLGVLTTSPVKKDTDAGGLPDGVEDANKNGKIDAQETDPNNPADDASVKDTDNDGLPDPTETAVGTDPMDADSDDDGVLDGQEPSFNVDSDADGFINALDPDSDNDRIFDGTELGKDCANAATNASANRCVADADAGATKTNPLNKDTDAGGKADGAEDVNHNGKIDGVGPLMETDPNNPADDGTVKDTDGDGLSDGEETVIVSNPNDADTDDDGVLDGQEPNPTVDTDGDGLINILDPDSDNDGIFDGTELGKDCTNPGTSALAKNCIADADPTTKTNPLDKDTDKGTKPDGAEDSNHNGKVDAGETDPNNPADDNTVVDMDGDGLSDREETAIGSDPMDADSDDDGLLDGQEANPSADTDGDGLKNILDPDSDNDGLFDGTEAGKDCSNAATAAAAKRCVPDADAGATKTSPVKKDTDNGGKADGAEDANLNGRIDAGETDPNNPADDNTVVDTDNDGLSDKEEVVLGSDPNDADTDDDGLLDGLEANPADDTDADGQKNVLDADSDGDGLFDGTEAGKDCANPATNASRSTCVADADPASTTSGVKRDTDNGGVSDGLEDKNRDGKIDAAEGDPNNPADDVAMIVDTDKDGLSDENETMVGSNPNDADSDDDGVLDGAEVAPGADPDGDGKKNVLDPDSDNDGLFDGTEMGKDCSNPGTDVAKGFCVADADGGVTKTDPQNGDTDRGSVSDGIEDTNRNGSVDAGEKNPNDPADDVPTAGAERVGIIAGGGLNCAFSPGHHTPAAPWALLALGMALLVRRRR